MDKFLHTLTLLAALALMLAPAVIIVWPLDAVECSPDDYSDACICEREQLSSDDCANILE